MLGPRQTANIFIFGHFFSETGKDEMEENHLLAEIFGSELGWGK
jgi:hypothetical protein